MTVRSLDGERLGKVFAVNEDEFLIEKGLFFPKDYLCRYSEISGIQDGEIILMHGKEGLHRFSFDASENREVLAGTGGGAGVGPGAIGASPAPIQGLGLGADKAGWTGRGAAVDTGRPLATEDEVSVPVYREKLDVIKHQTQSGEVRIHKDVVEETQQVTVPLRRERVSVERRNVKERPAVNASFQEETVVVPLRAEEVEIRKRPVVDEEVIIRREAVEDERQIDETVRRERVEIDGDQEPGRKLDLSNDDPLLRRS
ncbi:YsnF/AvaK domain-containing protein [Stigmatella sp. ncwal1]|uniref:YsnF/AvaK domain-containing protein n=1 Tax=Stigmatella ashevillensis TaxID=2995309 RepID=A0ABT5DH93_9BACT|nr:YsnF/AvaK domain-containing protein [Stigmatella ashevillena]MDC0713039.1 YsnF/AvaK domain-containing protein [Stigmatella ashevillena]